MRNGQEPTTKRQIIGIIVIACVVVGAIIFGLMIVENISSAHPKITTVPCEKIVTVTEKYSRISEWGMEYHLVVESTSLKQDLTMSQSAHSKALLNKPVLIFNDPISVDYKVVEVKNVTKMTGTDCINCCSVEYVK